MQLRAPTEDDAEAVLAVVVARDVADIGRPDYTLDDVRTDWAAPDADVAKDFLVAEDDGGAIVGYAVIDRRSAMVLVHPDAEGRGIGTRLREAMEARAAERGEPPKQTVIASNAGGVAHLSAAGYRRVHVYQRMRGELADAPAGPSQAAVRPFDLDREGQAVHAVVEAAFSEIVGNVAEPYDVFHAYVSAKTGPAFRLAIDDNRGIAGVAIGECWPEGVGYVGFLAVDGRARGRGYGAALLVALLNAFRAVGLATVELSVQSANAPATRLYESVGMAEAWRFERWQR